MKRQWYFTNLGALALIGLALVCTGCPNSTDGPTDGPDAPPAATSIDIGYDNGTITVKNAAGATVSGITLSKTGTGTTQTVTLNADGSFTGMTWYVDGVNKGTGASITLKAADYTIRLHSLTFSGWRNGVYLSSASIPFTVQN
jgi:hypothetical protein